jgi:pimeloyl-ACP methyl ester carboxylesterase
MGGQMGKTIVFGGWAVPPGVLENVFWSGADYVDVNRLMPKLFDSSQLLKSDWADIIIDELRLANDGTYTVIAGWSAGAMIAYALARVCRPKKLILLSATPCFCRKEEFPSGMRSSVLDKMIDALGQDKTAVLRLFYERCGLEYDPAAVPDYTVDELTCGLMFLKQADLRSLTPPSTRPMFFHGTDDQVVPISASKYFCDQTDGEHTEVAGNHAFFIKHRTLFKP